MSDPSPILKCSPLGIYAPNPSFNRLATRLHQLMIAVVRSTRVIKQYAQLSDTTHPLTLMGDSSLPVAPVFLDMQLSTDTIDHMERAQYDALVTYFGFCLLSGSYENAWIHEDILPTALKRSSMSDAINDDVMQSWAEKLDCVEEALEGRQVMLNGQNPAYYVPEVVYTAQGEILAQYYSFAFVKGPLSNAKIDQAKRQALLNLSELTGFLVKPTPLSHMDHDDDQLSIDSPTSDDNTDIDAYDDDAMSNVSQQDDQASHKESTSPVFSAATASTEETMQITDDDKQSLPDTTSSLPADAPSQDSTATILPAQSTLKSTSWANVAGLQRDKPVKSSIKKREPSQATTSIKDATTITTTGAKGKRKSAKCIYHHFYGKCQFTESQCHFAHKDLSNVDTCEAWRQSPDSCDKGNKCLFLHKHQQKPYKNNLTKTRLCYDYMNSRCIHTEATCKYAHEETSKVPVCPDWNGIPGSCKKYEGWCNLLHPDIEDTIEKQCKINEQVDMLIVKQGYESVGKFPTLKSLNASNALENSKPLTSTSYAATVKGQVPDSPPSSMLRAPSPASSHATQVSLTIYDESKRKTQLCKYFKKGTCKFSTEEQCHFAHDDMAFVSVCPLYKEGKCKNKDECTFLHGLPRDDCRRKTKLCLAYLQNECDFDEDTCDYAHEDTSRVLLCHYAASGLCISDPCCFRHTSPNDSGTTKEDIIPLQLDPVALHDQSVFPHLPGSQAIAENAYLSFVDETLYSDAAKKPPKIPEREKVILKRDPVDEEAMRHESLRNTKMCRRYWGDDFECFYGDNCWFAHDDLSKVRTCYFWIQGYCIHDKKCPLLHPEREDDGYVPLSDNTDNKNARYNSRIRFCGDDIDYKKTRKCWFFWHYEGCQNDPCYFAHEDLTDVGVCYYWQHNKKCPWDPACPYLHEDKKFDSQTDASPKLEPSTTVNEHDPRDEFAKQSIYAMINNTISLQRQRLVTKFRSKPSEDVVPRVASGAANNEALYREHRKQAFGYADRMIQYTQKAEEARERGELTEAETHERDARYFAKQMKAEHAKASQKIFEECNRGNPRKKYIDLHGQHVDEALQYIQRWFAEFQDQRDIVYIVTGAGRHSRGIKGGKLRPAVEEYLKSRYMMRECSVHDDTTNSGGIYAVWYCVHSFVSSPARTCVYCSFKHVQQ